jgi:hypothetical protein
MDVRIAVAQWAVPLGEIESASRHLAHQSAVIQIKCLSNLCLSQLCFTASVSLQPFLNLTLLDLQPGERLIKCPVWRDFFGGNSRKHRFQTLEFFDELRRDPQPFESLGGRPSYCHLPAGRDMECFEQLTAEKKYTRYHNGFAKHEWRKDAGARNEALDCRVYAYAVLQSLFASGLRLDVHCDRFEKMLGRTPARTQQPRPEPMQAAAEPEPKAQMDSFRTPDDPDR